MDRRSFFILLFIIAVMSALVLSNRQDKDSDEASVLLPGLDGELNEITQLTIRTAGNRTVATLIRGDEHWTVAEYGNYPADVGKIRRNLIALADATVVEQKTADPELYARLGVEDIANEDAAGTELVIDGPNEPYRVIIGKTGIRGNNAYARKPDSAGSLLIAAELDLGTDASDWLDRTIIDIPPGDVSHVTTTHPDNETVRIKNTGTDGFRPADLPTDVKITETGEADSVGSVLAGLTFDDLVSRENTDTGDTPPVVTRFETVDGLTIVANVYTDGDQRFVGFEFAASDDTAIDRAAELNARLGEWLFVIPGYKLDQLTRHRSDLFDLADG